MPLATPGWRHDDLYCEGFDALAPVKREMEKKREELSEKSEEKQNPGRVAWHGLAWVCSNSRASSPIVGSRWRRCVGEAKKKK